MMRPWNKSSASLGVVAVSAVAVAAAVAFKWSRQRRQQDEDEVEEEHTVSKVEAVKSSPEHLELQEAAGDNSTTADASEERSEIGLTPTVRSPASAAAKPAAEGDNCPLLSCPWHDALAFFLSSSDLGKVSYSCTALRAEVTVEAPRDGTDEKRPSRLLLVPAVELRIETAEEELRRVSIEHIRILRVWQRMSFNAVAVAVQQNGAVGLRSLEKFVVKGCPLHPDDVHSLLKPVLAAT
ncbi:unnamed protein product, partial [Polarella glacialis]